jgi:hypothetical protein
MGFTVRNLQFFRTNADNMPNTTPATMEKNASVRKLPKILNGVAGVNSQVGHAYSMTVLNRIMHTASLVIPSPKTKLKSLGYSS